MPKRFRRKKRKISSEATQELVRFVVQNMLTAGGIILMQDHGFTQGQLVAWQKETLKIFPDVAAGLELPEERQEIAKRLRRKRIEEIEGQK